METTQHTGSPNQMVTLDRSTLEGWGTHIAQQVIESSMDKGLTAFVERQRAEEAKTGRRKTGVASLLDASKLAGATADGKIDARKAADHALRSLDETLDALRKEGAEIPTRHHLTTAQVVGVVVGTAVLAGIGGGVGATIVQRRRAAKAAEAAAPPPADTSLTAG